MKKRQNSYLEQLLQQVHLVGLPAPEREVSFHPTRRWRFDAAWAEQQIAIEYQGGVFYRQASHSSIAGITRDYEKFTEASILGWKLIIVTAETVNSGAALTWVLRAWGRE
jgi:hypothetical protein